MYLLLLIYASVKFVEPYKISSKSLVTLLHYLLFRIRKTKLIFLFDLFDLLRTF